jgi:hypothetical protein
MANALTNITNLEALKSWKSRRNAPSTGVVKRDWVPTGRIDFGSLQQCMTFVLGDLGQIPA